MAYPYSPAVAAAATMMPAGLSAGAPGGRHSSAVPPAAVLLVGRQTSCCAASLARRRPAQHTCQRVSPEALGRRSVAMAVSSEREVEGALSEFCDNEVCNASPQVEEVVRSLAKDIELHRWSTRLFQADCQYSDMFRSFQGVEKYQRWNFVKETVESPRASVQKLRMVDKANSVITWRLQGTLQGGSVDIVLTEEFEHNQLTGRVSKHKESWNAASGGMAFNAARAAWSAAQTQADLGQLISESLDELSGGVDDEQPLMRDPSDPTKFFQEPDDGTNDMIQYALFVAVLYLIFQVYSNLNQM